MPLMGVQSDTLPCPLSLPAPPTGTLIPETWKTVSQINQSGKDGGAGEATELMGGCRVWGLKAKVTALRANPQRQESILILHRGTPPSRGK